MQVFELFDDVMLLAEGETPVMPATSPFMRLDPCHEVTANKELSHATFAPHTAHALRTASERLHCGFDCDCMLHVHFGSSHVGVCSQMA